MHELHYYPGNASLFPHMLLRELGCPFELNLVDRDHDAQKSPAYLALNPNGKIPVLVSGGRAIYETCAIGLFLADTHPEAELAPLPGSPHRGDYYKWMAHVSSVLQAEFRAWFYPEEFVIDPAQAPQVKDAVGARLTEAFGRISDQLRDRPWLLMMIRWGRTLPKPAREIGGLGAYAEQILARPQVAKAFEVEGLAAPFV